MVGDREKPKLPTEEQLQAALLFLDDLRESGVTNMYGASPYVQDWWADEYGEELGSRDAREITVYWMKTFGERQKKE